MDISLILSSIAILISLGSLLITYSMNRSNLIISWTPPLFNWRTDYFYSNYESGILLKWIRIINNSSQPISIYEINLKDSLSIVMESHSHLKIDEPLIRENLTDDESVISNLLKPIIKIDSYSSIEGYVYMMGVYPELYDGSKRYTLIFNTSRKTIQTKINLDFTERDI